MTALTLIIGNKNYSSWSLRPWLLLSHPGVDFEEQRIWLYTDEGRAQLREQSPSAKVPVLVHGDVTVWESLAICEYVADLRPDLQLWPADRAARAHARSVSAEMHAGFSALRSEMPMNCRRDGRPIEHSAALDRDIERVVAALSEARERFGADGPFLYGRFSVADAMYAPVAIRFRGYGVEPGGAVGTWVSHVLGLPAMRRWMEAGREESAVIAGFDVD